MYVAVTERQATPTQVFSYGIVYLQFYEIKIINSKIITPDPLPDMLTEFYNKNILKTHIIQLNN